MQVFKSLDAFRGIAALMVVLFHSPFFSHDKPLLFTKADIFVDFFFILSGFVITHAYMARLQAGYSLKRYMQARLARLYPLHLIVLLLWLLYAGARYAIGLHINIDNSPFFMQNDLHALTTHLALVNAHGLDNHLSWNAPAWSIGAEFSCYVVFAVLTICLPKHMNKITFVVTLLVLCYFVIYITKPHTLLRTFDMGFVRALGGFFTGVAIYKLRQHFLSMTLSKSKTVHNIVEITLITLMLGAVMYLSTNKIGQLVCFTVFAVTIFVFSFTSGFISSMLALRLPQYLGQLSYSIYMTHMLIIVVIHQSLTIFAPSLLQLNNSSALWLGINLLLLTVVSGFSAITFKLIEEPCIKKWKPRH
ncbi:acyltransferase family protein [Pseudoalteromonas ruthenica]|uniref:acyltransferase family protein n=1 Tax=Pseudoalteromonas ruthenica TaxID=151081 RepID=UPI0009DB5698|nr:acyltransferase [Pseudoalteromonas ruthenica]